MNQYFSVFKKKYIVCPGHGIIDIMGCHHNRNAIFRQLVNNFINHSGMFGIQCCCRLIQNDDIRVHNQNISNGNLLLLSAAQSVGGLVAERCNLQIINHLFHLFFCFVFRNSQIQNTKRYFLINTCRKQLIVRVLKYNADFASQFKKPFARIINRFPIKIEST